MSKGIDYSKWDQLQDSSDEEEGEGRGEPHVTRFDEPMSVTLGGSTAAAGKNAV
jgi:hypothetical protein